MGKSNAYKLRLPEDLASLIRGMHPTLKKKVRASLDAILSDPVSGKALKDDLVGLRSFKIGRVRIISIEFRRPRYRLWRSDHEAVYMRRHQD